MLVNLTDKEYACLLRIRAADDEQKNIYYGVLNVPYDDWFIERAKASEAERIRDIWQDRFRYWKQIDTEYGKPARISKYSRGTKAMEKEIEQSAQRMDRKQECWQQEIRQLMTQDSEIRRAGR